MKEVSGYTFHGYGSHCDNYPCTYLTAAAAVGMAKDDVDSFVKRLDKVLAKWKKDKGRCHAEEKGSAVVWEDGAAKMEGLKDVADLLVEKASVEGDGSARCNDPGSTG